MKTLRPVACPEAPQDVAPALSALNLVTLVVCPSHQVLWSQTEDDGSSVYELCELRRQLSPL